MAPSPSDQSQGSRAQAWEIARMLVVSEGRPYKEAAEKTGIPLSTLQKRAADEDWVGQRKTAISYSAQGKALKRALMDRALALITSPDADPNAVAQAVYALQRLESAYPELRQELKITPAMKLEIAARVLELIVDYLQGADRDLLAALQPHIQPLGLKLEEAYGQ